MRTSPTFRRSALLAAALLALAGCGGSAPATSGAPDPSTSARAGSSAPRPAASSSSTAERDAGAPSVRGTVATGLDAPWGLAFLPGGDALVSERDRARIVRVTAQGQVRPVGAVPGVDPGGEGGLLGLAVAPTFERDRYVYAYFTAADDNRLVRMRYDDGGGLGEPEVLVEGIDKGTFHNGGRIAFGPDGFLYVATGDAAERSSAQDRGDLNGKILRMTAEGEPAPGNPFGDSLVYSLGHRNVQGLDWDDDGRLWASEFGQNTYDELNLIEIGKNYGWPEVEGRAERDGFTDPVVVWDPSEASPSGIAVRGGAVYVAGLRGRRLWQVPVPNGRAGEPQGLLTEEYGRLRTVEVAPDGSLWLITSNTDGRGNPREGDDRILRLS